MSRRIEFVHQAEDGELFAPGAFDGQIGQEVPVSRQANLAYRQRATGVLREAEVAEDGRSVRLVVDLPDSVPL